LNPYDANFFDQVEYLAGQDLRRPEPRRPVDELLLHRRHQDFVFFPMARRIRSAFASVNPAISARDLHDLFLVHDDPVRLVEDRLEFRMNVGDLLRPVLAGDEIADHLHRSRAVQRVSMATRSEIVVGFSFLSQSAIPELSN